MKVLSIIPARYGSTRFPGKLLQPLAGIPLIRHTYENAKNAGLFDSIIVATDDIRIAECVTSFGGQFAMTSPDHISGTDRCAQALEVSPGEWDVIINLQGDEPFVSAEAMKALIALFKNPEVTIGSLVQKIATLEELQNPKNAKVVMNASFEALYFSRAAIPYIRGYAMQQWLQQANYWNHIGIYGFRPQTLREIVKLPPGRLELSENLEQLRWIENGYTIKMVEVEAAFIGIDTPEDLAAAQEWLMMND